MIFRALLVAACVTIAPVAFAQKAPVPGKIDVSLHKVVNTDTMQLTILGTLAKGDTLVPMSHMREELATTKKDLQDVVNDYVALRAYTVKVTDSLKAELKKKQTCPPKSP